MLKRKTSLLFVYVMTGSCNSFQPILSSHHNNIIISGPNHMYSSIRKCNRRYNHKTIQILCQSKVDGDTSSPAGKVKGVYSRPSAAIEKGSGFYIPGLEGSKVRLLFGTLVLLLNYINHTFSNSANVSEVTGFAFSEKIATFYGIFLLLQGVIEFGKEIGLGFDNIQSVTSSRESDDLKLNQSGVEQFISPFLSELGTSVVEAVSWAAASFYALTPADSIMLMKTSYQSSNDASNSVILYRLGDVNSMDNDNVESSIAAATKTVFQSKSGRVSIPSEHPVSSLLPEENRRCVLLQQVHQYEDSYGDRHQFCLLVGSDQLLVSFTKNDLKWLGSISKYLSSKLIS